MVEHARLDFLQRAAAVQNARTQVVVLRTGQPGQLTARVQAGLHRLRLVREKMFDFHHSALARQDHAPLDQVFQLAHVARPVVLLQCLQGSLSKAREARVVQRAKAHQHALRQQLDVGMALAQRRNANGIDIEAVHQVTPETAGPHRLLQVDVGGGHQPHIDFARGLATHAFDFTFLQYAQQFGLGRHWQLTHLVEQQGAAVGTLEASGARGVCAGVGPLLHAKQLGLDQLGRQGGAIHRHERCVGTA